MIRRPESGAPEARPPAGSADDSFLRLGPITGVDKLFLLALIGYSVFAVAGVGLVPFHPDESSLLYQSRDLERYLTDPGSLAWSPDQPLDSEQRYRALNPPLPKYLLGAGRALAGYSTDSVSVDWDWSEDWETNLGRGALPPAELLTGARLASTLLLPAALLLIYRIGRQLGGDRAGALSAGLLAFNALFLLHGRRAMMEGTLFLGLCLALWMLLKADRRPWLAGLAVGIALCAKHSLLPLLPLGALAAGWPTGSLNGWRDRALRSAQFTVAAAAVFLILNPFLWSSPLAAAAKIAEERGSLVGDQLLTQELAEHAAMELPMSAADRLASFLGQVFFAPAQFLEAANYRTELAADMTRYSSVPGHRWLRGWAAGGALFGLTLVGVTGAAVSLPRLSSEARRSTALLLLATLGMAAALLIAVPFPFQRYYLPMLPFSSLWAALAIAQLGTQTKRLLSRRAARN